jgi:hypothetical protein
VLKRRLEARIATMYRRDTKAILFKVVPQHRAEFNVVVNEQNVIHRNSPLL